MSKFFEGIKKGLEDAIAFEKKKKTLRTRRIKLPEPPMEYEAKDIKKIREKGHYSQGVLAAILNVSIRTVQSWECGVRVPNHSALRLLEIIDKGIYRPKILSKQA